MNEETGIHRFPHSAMGTTFEILIAGEDASYSREAAMEAFREIDRLEMLLSRFDPCSEISQINRLKPGESMPVGPDVLECLLIARKVHGETNGAFDVTIGALMDHICGRRTTTWHERDDLKRIRLSIGMSRLAPMIEGRIGPEGIKPKEFRICLLPVAGNNVGVTVDLGGIGKGYALDRIVYSLREWGIESALLNAGTSTILCMEPVDKSEGVSVGQEGWPVGIGGVGGKPNSRDIVLTSGAISGSGVEMKGTHIIDPRTFCPVDDRAAAWVFHPSSAGIADALSTAFMVMSIEEIEAYCTEHDGVAALVVDDEGSEPRVLGSWAFVEERPKPVS